MAISNTADLEWLPKKTKVDSHRRRDFNNLILATRWSTYLSSYTGEWAYMYRDAILKED